MPKISMIVPVYNCHEELKSCMDSLLNQTFSDFEIILVDDGSNDGSEKICDDYARRDARVSVYHKENGGQGSARNFGITKATGKYCTFPDSDDIVDKYMLEKTLRAMEKHNADLVVYPITNVFYNDHGKETNRTIIKLKDMVCDCSDSCHKAFEYLFFSSAFNNPVNKLYVTEIIKTNSIKYPDLRRSQDAVFNLDYYRHVQRLVILSDSLYYYRQNNQAKIWKKFPKDIYKIEVEHDRKIVELLSDWDMYTGDVKARFDSRFLNAVYWAIGFYRNPLWGLDTAQKKEYLKAIAKDEYIRKRLTGASLTSTLQRKKADAVLSEDPTKILKAYWYSYLRNQFYEGKFYQKLSRIKSKL